jgi:hypothetical protein
MLLSRHTKRRDFITLLGGAVALGGSAVRVFVACDLHAPFRRKMSLTCTGVSLEGHLTQMSVYDKARPL